MLATLLEVLPAVGAVYVLYSHFSKSAKLASIETELKSLESKTSSSVELALADLRSTLARIKAVL